DVAACIPGLYRVLDLIRDRGSGGLVDKIIIEQDGSLGRFVNSLKPNTYQSINKIDLTALDDLELRLVGLYGSKPALVDFLQKKTLIDDVVSGGLMLKSTDGAADGEQLTLRSGIYLLRSDGEDLLYVIYWPEDTTWNDNATHSVGKNRVTFMRQVHCLLDQMRAHSTQFRYLSKITHQTVCLLSDDHLSAIVWRDDIDSDDEDVDDDDCDRLFAFEVRKTNQQEEGIVSTHGFTINHSSISSPSSLDGSPDDHQLRPRLAQGETQQALLTAAFVPAVHNQSSNIETFTEYRLKDMLQKESIKIGDEISSAGLQVLLGNGFKHRSPGAVSKYVTACGDVDKNASEMRQQALHDMTTNIEQNASLLLRSAQSRLSQIIRTSSPPNEGMCRREAAIEEADVSELDYLNGLLQMHSDLHREIESVLRQPVLHGVTTKKFKRTKENLIALDYLLGENLDHLNSQKQKELVESVLNHGVDKQSSPLSPGFWVIKTARSVLGSIFGADSQSSVADIPHTFFSQPDDVFLARLHSISDKWPVLSELTDKALAQAKEHFMTAITKEARSLQSKVQSAQRRLLSNEIDRKVDGAKRQKLEDLRSSVLAVIASDNMDVSTARMRERSLKVPSSDLRTAWGSPSYRIRRTTNRRSEPSIRYTVHPLELTQDDRHRMQEDSRHHPRPRIHPHSSFTFTTSASTHLLHFQLLPGTRCLSITRDETGNCKVYVCSTMQAHNVIGGQPKKLLNRDRIGDNFLLTYDETHRILALCSVSSREPHLHLNTFMFDETYTNLQGMGQTNLSPWYDISVSITHMEFVSNSEELLFVDTFARARIFSLLTQQFRPAMLQLPNAPSAVQATPDGSCFLAVFPGATLSDTVSVRAYHWSSFGSSEGIVVDVPDDFASLDSHIFTSFVSRSNVHWLALDLGAHSLSSMAFKITCKSTDFAVEERGSASFTSGRDRATVHNSIIDCHAQVWSRFPVVPAIGRETILSGQRQKRNLTFVSSNQFSPFSSHFASIIKTFEKTTRKPVGDELSSIQVLSVDTESFLEGFPFGISTFRAGEWLVELLCLIPIHIAVTRDNRFIPLKDGVWSDELERSLLGADVVRITDCISFGWYESLFQSYKSKTPVKVVSSMGEQSVGKSYALNHLVDTSFAGSAMRTTEGVWMSVTPTKEVLIVALDFEGVHSIERSAQEDSLLVLFNTAISNLVLFRNNFAVSRDIAGLFQSFQSSSTILSPDDNPELFQSMLAIIIKANLTLSCDRFHLKFQQIVQTEQAMNFITRLHKGRFDIVPWNVIESKQFYTLFKAMKRSLDRQPITHPTGSVFLQRIKTLMAKLKANDWSSMSQNMATQRAHLLDSLLPHALIFGAAEVVPDFEPLSDLNTSTIIDLPDSRAHFYLTDIPVSGQPISRNDALQNLFAMWKSSLDRFVTPESEWVDQLQGFLNHLVEQRVELVHAWLISNTAGFPPTHADIQGVRRRFDSLIVDLKAGVQLCSSQCTSCNLRCLLAVRHEGDHHCRTDHVCPQRCQLTEDADHGADEPCGLPAGHPGLHLCEVTAHLCAKQCSLHGKRGCQGACVMVVDHPVEEDHMCAAQLHECGKACSLSGVPLSNGKRYNCSKPCSVSCEQPHLEHRCDTRQCPIDCKLCKRLCSARDHFHALDPAAVHLCGQEHACMALCSSKGTCHIKLTPEAIRATFSGAHETFQYTKYSQAAKRLPCVVTIPAGKEGHAGPHSHDLDPKCFHFCETQCPDCRYFCTLPLGHAQREHDTSHGSMSYTRWAVDGPDGTVLEVDGRKFGSHDEGAPMLCSMYCQAMGRHAHIAYCRSDDPAACGGAGVEHISTPMQPHPERPKDFISHALHWQRTGTLISAYPYSQEDQTNVFAKCDRMCSGMHHNSTAHGPAQPSYCTLPILHPRQALDQAPPGGLGYISNDGHSFMCRNPAVLRQAFHLLMPLLRSGSMGLQDRLPLDNTPTTQLIRRRHNDRLGAVCSALHGFWEARHHAVTAAAGRNAGALRRDAYSILLFNTSVITAATHDFHSNPTALLNLLLAHESDGGTDFITALESAKACMEANWSTERSPVIVFLSDGEAELEDETMQDVCRRAIALGKPLSFHGVAFGPDAGGILRRMTQIARDVESRAPPDPLNPHAAVPSSYNEAMDTVRLAETFLGIADSLAKPRGALFRG
ncbi:uncharacterized protein BXZ73DRAFT_56103, partial [Epithele typhae]|uniref:uncharacterized protein n=1 Tax=Epithele typhae TaxID=378194 RepID=UPI002007D7FF